MSNNNEKKLFLAIDANAIVHRAFHAYPPTLALSDGTQTNAVYGFTTMFLAALEKYHPEYIACAFDTKAPTFRHKEYPDYKATRKPTDETLIVQFPMVEEILRGFNVPIIKVKGFEADDILGTMAHYVTEGKWTSQNMEMVILSGDKDLLQLVDDNVYVSLPKGSFKNLEVYDRTKTHQKYGYYPDQVIDFKGMTGDTSDNIPGIKGVGKKTALRLLDKYGDWEGIYKNIDKISTRWANLLKEGIEQGEFSRKLAEIDQDVPLDLDLESCLLKDFRKQNVMDLFVKYEFKSLVGKIPDSLEDEESEAVASGEQMGLFHFVEGELSVEKEGVDQQVVIKEQVLEDGEIEELFEKADRVVMAYMDEELIGEKEALLVRFEWEPDGDFSEEEKESHKKDKVIHISDGECQQLLTLVKSWGRWMERKDRETLICGWEEMVSRIESHAEGRVSLRILKQISYRVVDVQLAAHMLSSGEKAGYGIDNLIFKYLKKIGRDSYGLNEVSLILDDITKVAEQQLKEFEEIAESHESNKSKWLASLGTVMSFYSNIQGFDSIEARYDSMRLVDNRFSCLLAEMENRGVRIDCELLKKMVAELESQIKDVEKRAFEAVGHEFNLASPKQLSEVLYDEIGIESPGKRNRTTKESVLVRLQDIHPVISCVLEYRELSKILGTYVKPFLEQAVLEGDISVIKTDFLQKGTSSGRLSSQEPNLQNLPLSGELAQQFRNAFLPRDGFKLVSIDYSQIESRIMADFSEDQTLINDFVEDKDIHMRTAMRIFDKDETEISSDERKAGKTVNFGILYGQTAFGLADQLKIDRSEAAKYIDSYFENYKGVAEYIDSVGKWAQRKGFVETMFGRRRYVRGLNARNSFARAAAIREAVNMPLQGSASELMKLAMLMIDHECLSEGAKYEGKAFMLLQIHDEIVFEVKEEVIEDFEKDSTELMKKVGEILDFKVPLDVHFDVGDMLSELK